MSSPTEAPELFVVTIGQFTVGENNMVARTWRISSADAEKLAALLGAPQQEHIGDMERIARVVEEASARLND